MLFFLLLLTFITTFWGHNWWCAGNNMECRGTLVGCVQVKSFIVIPSLWLYFGGGVDKSGSTQGFLVLHSDIITDGIGGPHGMLGGESLVVHVQGKCLLSPIWLLTFILKYIVLDWRASPGIEASPYMWPIQLESLYKYI